MTITELQIKNVFTRQQQSRCTYFDKVDVLSEDVSCEVKGSTTGYKWPWRPHEASLGGTTGVKFVCENDE